MNKNYIIIDGKVIIEDEKNKKKIGKYQDNLHDVLILENLIEVIKGKIEQLEDRQRRLGKYKKRKHFIPYEIIMMCILLIIVFSIYSIYMASINEVYIMTFLKQTKVSFWLLSSLIPLLIASLDTLIDYSKYKHYKKTFNGILYELNYLKKELILTEEKLNTLKEEEYCDLELICVNDQEKINALTKTLDECFLKGYNYQVEKGKVLKKVKK